MVSLVEIYRYTLLGEPEFTLATNVVYANLLIVLVIAAAARFVHSRAQSQYAELL